MDLAQLDSSSFIYNFLYQYTYNLVHSSQVSHIITSGILLIIFLLIMWAVDRVIDNIIKLFLLRAVRKTKTRIDDYLIHHKALDYLSHFVSITLSYTLLPFVFKGFPNWNNFIHTIVEALYIINTTLLINALSKTVKSYLKSKKRYKDKPIDGFFQIITILLWIMCITILITFLFQVDIKSVVATAGATSAIIVLIFRDTILGFVASVQVTVNDIIRVGDWIEMTKFGADGYVIQINLSTIMIENFDKTITSIPTHLLLTDSFKNYRSMQKSGGRRIKRFINIKISSIKFLQPHELEKLKNIQILKDYINNKQIEIQQHNQNINADTTNPINGRRMTNIGLFREYIALYVQNNPNIHKQYTMMVRQLQPSQYGVPIELYTFANNTQLEQFERIMSDIFDHIFASIKIFDLEIFESPSSEDVQNIIKTFKPIQNQLNHNELEA